MIGTAENAARAASGELPRIATGGGRIAYWGRDDVVYKIERREARPGHVGGGQGENQRELENAERLAGPGIPPVTLWPVPNVPGGVIAMPYYPGKAGELTAEEQAWADALPVHTKDCNLRRDDAGFLYVIDLGNR